MNSVIVIRPIKTLSLSDLTELWTFRELIYFLAWRDLKVRYKQTAIGVLWAVFQPLITMLVFTMFFGRMLNVPSDGVPYPIFVYIGLLFWLFFSLALNDASNVLVSNQPIVTKVYFPRLALPIASVLTKVVDFAIASLLLACMLPYYGYMPKLTGLLMIPPLVLITFLAALGSGFFLSALNVKYRDVRFILPFFIQIMLYLTPVIYPVSIAGRFGWILSLNPMMGVIQTARAALLGTNPINWALLAQTAVTSVLFLLVGLIYFKRVERHFADII
jgi:lipopolysaccharide transport system permease protein